MKDLYLFHSGTKGMKWGIRRYQNDDGTLTEAGKARYSKSGSRLDARDMTDEELDRASRRLQREQQYNQLTGKQNRNPGAKTSIAKKTILTGLGSAAATALGIYVNAKFFGDKDSQGKSKLGGKELAKKIIVGSTAVGGAGALMMYTNASGGQVYTNAGGIDPIADVKAKEPSNKKKK